jgi:hypothetical protein
MKVQNSVEYVASLIKNHTGDMDKYVREIFTTRLGLTNYTTEEVNGILSMNFTEKYIMENFLANLTSFRAQVGVSNKLSFYI